MLMHDSCSGCCLRFWGHSGVDFGWWERLFSQSVSLGWRVVMRIKAHLFDMVTDAKQTGDLQQEETNGGQGTRPKYNHQDHDELNSNSNATNVFLAITVVIFHATKSTPSMVVVDTPTPVEQACGDDSPGSTKAVDWAGIHRVINVQLLEKHGCGLAERNIKKTLRNYQFTYRPQRSIKDTSSETINVYYHLLTIHWSSLVDETSNQARGEGTSALHVAATGCDRDQTGQDAVAQGANIVPGGWLPMVSANARKMKKNEYTWVNCNSFWVLSSSSSSPSPYRQDHDHCHSHSFQIVLNMAGNRRSQSHQHKLTPSITKLLVKDEISKKENGNATSRRSQSGVHGYLSGQGPIRSRLHGQSGAWIEAVPTEPKSESAQDHQWHVVALEFFRVGEATFAWSKNGRASKSSDTTAKMNNTCLATQVNRDPMGNWRKCWRSRKWHEKTDKCKKFHSSSGDSGPIFKEAKWSCHTKLAAWAGKIHVSHSEQGRQPATTPSGCHNHRIDEACHEECEGRIGWALNSFSNCAAYDGSTGSAEGPLEEPAQPGSLSLDETTLPYTSTWIVYMYIVCKMYLCILCSHFSHCCHIITCRNQWLL